MWCVQNSASHWLLSHDQAKQNEATKKKGEKEEEKRRKKERKKKKGGGKKGKKEEKKKIQDKTKTIQNKRMSSCHMLNEVLVERC